MRPKQGIRIAWVRILGLVSLLICTNTALCQGGPPMRTDDPGTPGNGNWEINTAFTMERSRDEHVSEVPLLDINYGVGDRVQLKFEIPFVSQRVSENTEQGWGNSLAGVKWRFFDRKGFSISTYPQLEFNNPGDSVSKGLADDGTRFLFPIEVVKTAGPVDLNFESGMSFSTRGERGWILGFAVGREVTAKWELIGELYSEGEQHEGSDTTLGLGTRFRLHGPLTLMFMAGHSVYTSSSWQPRFFAYTGLQLNLERKRRSD